MKQGKSMTTTAAQPPNKCFLGKDMLSMIVPHVSYMPLGYLSSTCKWIRVSITEDQIRQCKERAKNIIGAMVPTPNPRFGVLFKIFNLSEEAVEVGLYHPDSELIVCRCKAGRFFIGQVQSHLCEPSHSLISLLGNRMKSYQEGKPLSNPPRVVFLGRSIIQEDQATIIISVSHGSNSACHDSYRAKMHPLFM